jgi:hypothetical protein
VDGSSTAYSSAVSAQNGYFTFAGTAGQTLGIAVTNVSYVPSSVGAHYVQVLRPNGTELISKYCQTTSSAPGCAITLQNLPATGTYTIVVIPNGYAKTNFTLTVSPPITGTLAGGGAAQSVNLASPGQLALLNFTAAAGETVALNVGSIVTVPASKQVNVAVYNAAGAVVVSSNTSTSELTFNLTNLAAGTYTVLVDSPLAITGTMAVQLASRLGGLVPVDGSSTAYSSAVSAQNGYFTFAGTAGQTVGIAVTGVSYVPTSVGSHYIQVLRPNGTELTSVYWQTTSSAPGRAITLQNLPTTGTYTIVVIPNGYAKMNFTLTVSPPITGTLTAGGAAQNVNLASPGHLALLNFTATASQSLVLGLSSIATLPASKQINVTVFNAGGSQVAATSTSTASLNVNLPGLAAGSYSVLIDSPLGITAAMSVQLQ